MLKLTYPIVAQKMAGEKRREIYVSRKETRQDGKCTKERFILQLVWNFPSLPRPLRPPPFNVPRRVLPPPPCPAANPCTHLALVNGNGPGQLQGQLLPAEEMAPRGLHRPAVSTDDLGDSTQEPDLGQP